MVSTNALIYGFVGDDGFRTIMHHDITNDRTGLGTGLMREFREEPQA